MACASASAAPSRSPAAIAAVAALTRPRRRGGLPEDRSETELGGLTDKVDRTLLILHAGDLDEDRLALAGHLRLTDAETVDTISDDVDRLVEGLLGDLLAVGKRLGFEHDGCPALQSRPSSGSLPARRCRRDPQPRSR